MYTNVNIVVFPIAACNADCSPVEKKIRKCLDMVAKTTNAHKYTKVYDIINTLFLLYFSATLVAIPGKCITKDGYYKILQKLLPH
jgi:hypothetical protein